MSALKIIENKSTNYFQIRSITVIAFDEDGLRIEHLDDGVVYFSLRTFEESAVEEIKDFVEQLLIGKVGILEINIDSGKFFWIED